MPAPRLSFPSRIKALRTSHRRSIVDADARGSQGSRGRSRQRAAHWRRSPRRGWCQERGTRSRFHRRRRLSAGGGLWARRRLRFAVHFWASECARQPRKAPVAPEKARPDLRLTAKGGRGGNPEIHKLGSHAGGEAQRAERRVAQGNLFVCALLQSGWDPPRARLRDLCCWGCIPRIFKMSEGEARGRADSGRLASSSSNVRGAAPVLSGSASGQRVDGSQRAARAHVSTQSGSRREQQSSRSQHGDPHLNADPALPALLVPESTAATTVRTRTGRAPPGAVTAELRPAGLPLVPAVPPGDKAVLERAIVPVAGVRRDGEASAEDEVLANALAYSINMETAEELERQCVPALAAGQRLLGRKQLSAVWICLLGPQIRCPEMTRTVHRAVQRLGLKREPLVLMLGAPRSFICRRNPGLVREIARWLTCRNASEAMQARCRRSQALACCGASPEV